MIADLLRRLFARRVPDTIQAEQGEDRAIDLEARRRGSRSWLSKRRTASLLVDDQLRYWAQTKPAGEVRRMLEELDGD